MSKKTLLYVLLSLTLAMSLDAQQKNLREQVYLHLNSAFLLTGETLYFSAYNTSATTGLPSNLSEVLYVELIDSARNPVFRQKISLNNGRGQGHFFISSLVSTGSYQLLAYTRWMKNFRDYFESTITIVNPFEEYKAPAKPKNSGIHAAFYPEGGKLLAGKPNVLVYTVTNLAGEHIHIKGKIMTRSGEKVTDIVATGGPGRFVMQPEANQSYQAILEDDQGNFHFFDLPAVAETGKIIQLSNERSGYKFTIQDTAPTATEMTLSISDGQNTVFNQQVFTNGSILVRKENLKPGAYRATLVDEAGTEHSVRLFSHPGDFPNPRLSNLKTYNPRSLVSIPVEVDQAAGFSVSVRKKEPIDHKAISAIASTYSNSLAQTNLAVSPDASWEENDNKMMINDWKWGPEIANKKFAELLPELRGELIAGKLVGANAGNRKLFYSLSGEQYQMYAAETDPHGNFQFRIDPVYGLRDAYIGTINQEDEPNTIVLEKPYLKNYPDFRPAPLYLDSAYVAKLVERSVRNQIENAYYETKKDMLLQPKEWLHPFGDFDFFYVLDDYNRFPELYEHFIEYIPVVVARKNRSRSKMKVLLRYLVDEQKAPLLLLDGVPVSADKILDFNPYKLESIGVTNTRFFHGPLVADGVVSFHTFEKDLQGFSFDDHIIKLAHQGLEPSSLYYFPNYDVRGEELSRIPDYRDQLYWEPQVIASPKNPYMLEFYTSDTTGEFEVVLSGFYENGEPLSIRETFVVTAPADAESN